MITSAKSPESITRRTLLTLTALGHISIAYADNPPPCDPCKIELAPSADPTHLKATVGVAKKAGLKGWEIPVTWNAMDVPHGAYTPECDNIDHQGLQAFDGWYVPTTMTKTFYMNSGTTRFAMSDNFYARYFDPCKGGPYKSGGSTYNIVKVKAPTPPPTDPNDPPGDPPGGGGGGDGGGDPPILPPHVDPHQGGEETHDPCPPGPFVPQECSPFQNLDTRVAADLPEPTQVEIVAENIAFNHVKNGFLQYNYDPATVPVPKYFLEEYAETVLDGGIQETPVGGSITRRVCQMTGELIVTQKEGNPSWYGVRSGPNVTITETTASGSFDVSSYDDCPNQVNDTPAVMMFASELADEYTKERMRDDAFHHAWEFKGPGYFKQEEAIAKLLINSSEEGIEYVKTRYKIRVSSDIPRPYKASWVEEFTPEDTNPDDDVIPHREYRMKTEDITGLESSIHEIDPKGEPEKEGVWRVYLFKVNADVDLNRDGIISLGDDRDRTLPTKPYKFWINNDCDIAGPVDDGTDFEEDDVEGTADSDAPGITCARDLEDFSRIWVDLSQVASMFDVAYSSLTVKARIDSAGMSPRVTLFRAVEPDGGRQYLHDDVEDLAHTGDTGWNQWHDGYQDELCTVGAAAVEIPRSAYTPYPESGVLHLLFEGKGMGGGRIVFEFFRNGDKIAESQPIYIKLSDVKEMYETYSIGDVNDWGVDYSQWPRTDAEQITGKDLAPPETEEEKDYVMFVHGWNMQPWEKGAYASTAFKRLWHQGYKGRFGAFRWPTFWWEDGYRGSTYVPVLGWIPLPDNFDASEQRAWNSGKPLHDLLVGKSAIFNVNGASKVRLYGHSMGNIVCSEALRLFADDPTPRPIHTYVSGQAALSAHVWNVDTPGRFPYVWVVPDVYGYFWRSGESNTDPSAWKDHGCVSYMDIACRPPGTVVVNHCNKDDFALSSWRTNQELKPNFSYSYALYPNRFCKQEDSGFERTLVFPNDRHEVFSYAAPSYSFATGAEPAAMNRVVNLKDPRFGFDETHKCHSGQFRSTVQKRWSYWKQFIEDCGFEE